MGIKNKKKVVILIIMFIILNIQVVKAYETDIKNEEVKSSYNNFMMYLNEGNEEVFSYIDPENAELYNNLDRYLNAMAIKGEITKVSEENDIYLIKTKIMAEGPGWNVSGMTVEYKFKKIDDMYRITETNLFDVIGMENVGGFILKGFLIAGGVILIILSIIGTIVYVVIKKNTK